MDESGKELELALPRALKGLRGRGTADVIFPPGVDLRSPVSYPPSMTAQTFVALGPTDGMRLKRVLRTELQRKEPRLMRPLWAEGEEAIPGLVISMRYASQDVYGVERRLRELDLAFRRAGATLERLHAGDAVIGWAFPMRPESAGLWVLDSRRGSYEVVVTLYGSLVIWATSSPVALAGLAALAIDSAKGVKRFGSWVVRHFDGDPDDGPPALGSSSAEGLEWGAKQTKQLAPVLEAAAAAGSGIEYECNSSTGDVKLTIYKASSPGDVSAN